MNNNTKELISHLVIFKPKIYSYLLYYLMLQNVKKINLYIEFSNNNIDLFHYFQWKKFTLVLILLSWEILKLQKFMLMEI